VSLVLDASITIAWMYPEESTAGAMAVWRRVAAGGAWVPGLWKLEVANVLELRLRRGRMDAAFVATTLADLESLPIEVDGETDVRAWSETLELARRHKLTLYDAAYLELALRRGMPLASLDRELRAAAEAEAVVVLGE
jgi:predicted nucleic acid-binding protein